MVKEIRIYIEGGGDGKNTKALMKQGFRQVFKSFKLNIAICGSRNNAFRDFRNALKSHPSAFNILLVDAEAPVTVNSSWGHLKFRDNWDKPSEVDDSHCYLMVQTMEAWFIADIEALKKFYGKNFLENAIPKTLNVENIDKENIERSLKAATRNTTKGEYHKIKHASKLLELLDVEKVCQASPSCDSASADLSVRLLKTLTDKITKV